MKSKPFIIALEGIPGVGKTTIMTLLDTLFLDIEGIEQILPKDLSNEEITLNKVFISDELKTDRCKNTTAKVVILDRYYQSTLAYHAASDATYGGSSLASVQSWHRLGILEKRLIKPDLTIIIDVNALRSVERKGRALDSSGKSPWVHSNFLEHMREYYLSLAKTRDENCLLIDGNLPINRIVEHIMGLIKKNVGEIK